MTARALANNLIVSNAPSLPGIRELAASALRGQSASLSGRIEDNRPGLGIPARDAVAGQCVSPDGVNDYATVGGLGTVRALSFFVCPTDVTSNTDGLITLNGTQSVSIVDGVITTTGLGSATIRQSATFTVGEFVLVSVDLGEAVAASGVEFFRVGTNYSSSKMSDIRFYTESLSESEHDQLAALAEDACANKPSAGHFKLDSVSTTHLLNSRGDQHATLNLHTHLSFRYSGDDVPVDYLNNKGYTLSDGTTQYLNDDGTGLIPADVYIPRLESDKAKCVAYDVDGNRLPLQYPGKAHKPMQLVDANCATQSGSTYWNVSELTGTETVVSSGGTAVPSISAGRIDFTAGTLWDLVLSNGSRYFCSESAGNKHRDVINGYDATVQQQVEVTYWGGSQDDFHANAFYGSSRYEHATLDDIRWPYSLSGTKDESYTPPAGYTIVSHYPPYTDKLTVSESNIDMHPVAWPIKGLSPMQDFHPENNPGNAMIVFFRTWIQSEVIKALDRLITYLEPLNGTRLSAAQKYTAAVEIAPDPEPEPEPEPTIEHGIQLLGPTGHGIKQLAS